MARIHVYTLLLYCSCYISLGEAFLGSLRASVSTSHQEGDKSLWERRSGRVRERTGAVVMKIEVPKEFSSNDWVANILNLPRSKLLKSFGSHLIFNTVWAGAVTVLAETNEGIGADLLNYPISSTPHSIMASALGLLLVFRSNASYERFWAARTSWGTITNSVRSIARLSQIAFISDREEYCLFLEYLKAFPWTLKQHLRNSRDDAEMIKSVSLSAEAMGDLQESTNPPLHACQRMTQLLSEVFLDGRPYDEHMLVYRLEMEKEISRLVDQLGTCERLLTTPIPRSYSRHTSRFLTVYLFTLPFVLVHEMGVVTPFVVFLICWGLLSIEGIAYFIEQPFDRTKNQLPLTSMCWRMTADVTSMAKMTGRNKTIMRSIEMGGCCTDGGGGGGHQRNDEDRRLDDKQLEANVRLAAIEDPF